MSGFMTRLAGPSLSPAPSGSSFTTRRWLPVSETSKSGSMAEMAAQERPERVPWWRDQEGKRV